jgi:hypothetical protein
MRIVGTSAVAHDEKNLELEIFWNCVEPAILYAFGIFEDLGLSGFKGGINPGCDATER